MKICKLWLKLVTLKKLFRLDPFSDREIRAFYKNRLISQKQLSEIVKKYRFEKEPIKKVKG